MAVSVSKKSTMALFAEEGDIYCHQVRIVLAEKGVTYDNLWYNPKDPASVEALADYNPYGSVPTLIDRDLVLYRAAIIMEYLDERFPHPPLMPVYPVARGRSRLMLYRIQNDWYQRVDCLLAEPDHQDAPLWRKELTESLLSVIPVFAEMPYFLSEEFSLVDCVITPMLWRLPLLGINLPKEAKPIIQYQERLFQRETFQASLSDAERQMRN